MRKAGNVARWLPVALVAVLWLLHGEARAAESCLTCHRDVKTDYEQSAHAKEFGCTACHGGDPDVVSLEAHSPEKRYVGKPARRAIPLLCATCHSDPGYMKPFGLQTDQYNQYEASRHGQQLAKGDTKVAVCTDCHATHRIVGRDNPTSTVAPRNVPETCARCHSDKALMDQYGLPADQLEKFRKSVHGIALFEEDHPSAPTCARCHGSHGATAPGVGEIGQVCGHCHSRTREHLNEGPHRKAVAEGKLAECASCHGTHEIATPGSRLYQTTCEPCHARDSTAFVTGQKLETLLSRSRESLETAAGELARVERSSPSALRYRSRLRQAQAYFLEALPIQHSLAVEKVEDLTRSARSISEEIRAGLHGVDEESRLRYLVLPLTWFFVLLAIAIAHLHKQERRKERSTNNGEGGSA